MSLSDAELTAFIKRMKEAHRRGYGVARSRLYLEVLSQEAGKAGYTDSAADLATLAEEVAAKRAGKEPEKEEAAKAPSKSKAKEPEPRPEVPPPPPEPKTEEATVTESLTVSDAVEAPVVEEAGYDSWTREKLYDEAKARGIEGRSEMSKAELIVALKASDAQAV